MIPKILVIPITSLLLGQKKQKDSRLTTKDSKKDRKERKKERQG